MTTISHPFHVRATRPHVAPAVTGVALLAGVGVGALAWSHQLSGGLQETGLNGVVPWGLYAVLFTFFLTASAGALGLASAALLLPRATLTGLVRPSAAVAVAGAGAALLTMVVDLARPQRVANLLLHPNWDAPFVWRLYGLLATLAVSVVLVALHRRAARAPAIRGFSVVGLLLALLLPLLAAWTLTLPLGQSTWDDPLLGPTLLAAATTGGVAVAVLAALTLSARDSTATASESGRLPTVLVTALGATSLLTVLGYVTALTSGSKERTLVEVVLPGGSWQWVFWTQWLALVVAVALLLVPRLRHARLALGGATAAAVVAVLALLTALLPASSTRPPVSAPPGTGTGWRGVDTAPFAQIGSYHPTWVEYGVAVGLLAVFVAVLLVAHGRASARDRG